MVPSRTSGVAPLSVFFDATGTTATATPRPFHDLEYRWDFGDPGSGNWRPTDGSATGRSRNSAAGPVAGHVFEVPGTYTVTVTAHDGTNTASGSVRITVQDPDVIFAGASTICFSASGSFTGCPGGARRVPTSDFDAAITSYAGTGRRLLLRRGDTFTADRRARITATGPGIVGAFGSGNRPVVQMTAGVNILGISSPTTPTLKDWRIMDLEMDGMSGNESIGVIANGSVSQLTVLRLDVYDCRTGVMLDEELLNHWNNKRAAGHELYDQIAIVDSDFTRMLFPGGSYGTYASARRLSYLGNNIDNNGLASSHLVRIQYVGKGVISNNTLTNPAGTLHALKLHAKRWTVPGVSNPGGAGTYSEQIVISDNKFAGGTAPWTVAIGPQNGNWDERVRDVIVERNWFMAGSGTIRALSLHAYNATVRNNLINMTGSDRATVYGIVMERRGAEGTTGTTETIPRSSSAYNNTVYSSTAHQALSGVRMNSPGTDLVVQNNLVYAPNANIVNVVWDNATTNPTISNNTPNGKTNPNFADPALSIPAHFSLGASSYAINAGAMVPVLSDYFRRSRSGVIDLGAAERP